MGISAILLVVFLVLVREAGSKPTGVRCWGIQNSTINRGATLMKYVPPVDCYDEISIMFQHGRKGYMMCARFMITRINVGANLLKHPPTVY